MRYLLLSVLVVFLVGIMITSASASFHCADRGGSVCLEYNPNGTCKSSMCRSDYQRASSQQAEGETLLLVIQFVIILAIVVTVIIVVIRLIRKSRRGNVRSTDEYSYKKQRINAYIILFVLGPILILVGLFLLPFPFGFLPVAVIISLGIWYFRRTSKSVTYTQYGHNNYQKREEPKSDFCENCGNILKPTSKFCAKCGTRRF